MSITKKKTCVPLVLISIFILSVKWLLLFCSRVLSLLNEQSCFLFWFVYVCQIILWLILWWKPVSVLVILSKVFFAGLSVWNFVCPLLLSIYQDFYGFLLSNMLYMLQQGFLCLLPLAFFSMVEGIIFFCWIFNSPWCNLEWNLLHLGYKIPIYHILGSCKSLEVYLLGP